MGAPADRRRDAAAELAPIFEVLTAAVQEADRIRADAHASADRCRAAADRSAGEIVARAREAAPRERAAAAALEREATARELAALATAADERAREVRRAAEARRPALVREILDEVRMVVAAACGLPVDRVPAVGSRR
ncbi:hypothetical protein ACFQX7_29570 [Luedemannella flava]